MKMKIKFMVSGSIDELENNINEFIKGKEVINIKFQEIPETEHTGCYLTVLIMYRWFE